MYKDRNKQREAVKEAVRRHRAKGITKVLQEKSITKAVKPANKRYADIVKALSNDKPPYALCPKCGVMNVRCICRTATS